MKPAACLVKGCAYCMLTDKSSQTVLGRIASLPSMRSPSRYSLVSLAAAVDADRLNFPLSNLQSMSRRSFMKDASLVR